MSKRGRVRISRRSSNTHTPDIQRGPIGESDLPFGHSAGSCGAIGTYSGHAAPALTHALTMRLNSALAIGTGSRCLRSTPVPGSHPHATSLSCVKCLTVALRSRLPFVR